MRIQHNIAALNSHRNLGINNAFTGKNLEKLSSGYRINRAGDDAAGLAISEKMRGQIRGLAMAEQNTQNGVSLIQTAEGALNETHAILQRMRELAVQSSNGTYDETVDRAQINKEFQAIKDEIDRISESTHYNGIKLIDGSLDLKSIAGDYTGKNVTAAQIDLAAITTGGTKASVSQVVGSGTGVGTTTNALVIQFSLDLEGNIRVAETGGTETVAGSIKFADGTLTFDAKDTGGVADNFRIVMGGFDETRIKQILESSSSGTFKVNFAAGTTIAGSAVSTPVVGDADFVSRYASGHSGVDQLGLIIEKASAGDSYGKQDVRISLIDADKYLLKVGELEQVVTKSALKGGIELGGLKVTVGKTADPAWEKRFDDYIKKYNEVAVKDIWLLDNADGTVASGGTRQIDFSRATATVGNELVFQIGANGGADQRVALRVAAMDSNHIGMLKGSTWEDGTIAKDYYWLADTSVATIDDANKAIEVITAATNQVSSQRAGLGALQNRLEHTLNNLGVSKENLTSAESVIRDVDMAKEMMDFTKNQILVQASQAMLAQANQLPQGVLSLLR